MVPRLLEMERHAWESLPSQGLVCLFCKKTAFERRVQGIETDLLSKDLCPPATEEDMARRPPTLRFVGVSHPLRSPDPEVASYDKLDGFPAGRVKFEDDTMAGWSMSKDTLDLWKQEFIYLYPDYEFLLPRISALTYYDNLWTSRTFFWSNPWLGSCTTGLSRRVLYTANPPLQRYSDLNRWLSMAKEECLHSE